MTIYTPVTDKDACSMIGEGVHTGLRKGTEAPGSTKAWDAISKKKSGWSEAVQFAVWGMHEMGYVICKVEEELTPIELALISEEEEKKS